MHRQKASLVLQFVVVSSVVLRSVVVSSVVWGLVVVQFVVLAVARVQQMKTREVEAELNISPLQLPSLVIEEQAPNFGVRFGWPLELRQLYAATLLLFEDHPTGHSLTPNWP